MSKLKKRDLERKGKKKQMIKEDKLVKENLVDLINTKGALPELVEE